jgi:N-glycosylase/DNA lyase
VISFSPERLHSSVLAVCGGLMEQLGSTEPCLREPELRLELVACLLSSQVRFEMAEVALARLQSRGMLDDDRWLFEDKNFSRDLELVLAGGLGEPSYRFPKLKAQQIARLRAALLVKSLSERIDREQSPRSLRAALVVDLPGIGPKQASMFLRNVGVTYELAILDVYVLRFLRDTGLLPADEFILSDLRQYESVEQLVRVYAEYTGFPAGVLDWAIWITMRAAKEITP